MSLVYLSASWVSGTEFDAVNWASRDFEFMRDPITETQLTSIKHSSGGFTLDASIAPLIAGGPARPALPRWDLVTIHRGMSSATGEAHILLEYLQASDYQGQNVWIEWTRSHGKAAPILWAAVRDAVHLERYDRLPEIFDQVRVDDDPKALKAALAKIMLGVAVDEAQTQMKAGDKAAARLAALVGLSYGHSDELRSLAGGAPSNISSDVSSDAADDAQDDAQAEAPRDAGDDAAGDDTPDDTDDAFGDDGQEK
ncbi:MAG: hypothetical protein ACTHK7_23270 [Aureliella sp.]